MKRSYFSLFMLFSAFLGSLSLSCKIGLGEAVDTVPPTVTLSVPPADAMVRDSFKMSGTWSDDLALDKIIVSLKNLETGKKYEFEATQEGKKTTKGNWSVVIEPVKDGKTLIPDGTYTATVTAYDTYEQTNIATQTFSIDNTCPILTISKPNSAEEIGEDLNALASFGKVFAIQGNYSDDSGVDSIELTFYDKEGVEITTTSLKVKGTIIDDNVAVFGDSLYTQLYGDNQEAGTKPYYCSIKIYDAARKIPATQDDKGNCCDYFYLSTDVQEFFSESTSFFKEKEAYAILNGSTSIEDASAEYVEWYNKRAEIQKTRSSFTLNPINNPSFTVTNYTSFIPGSTGTTNELDKSVEGVGIYEFKNKSQLSVTVSPGLDNIALKKDSLGLSLVECDKAGKVLKNEDGENINEIVIQKSKLEFTNLNSSWILKTSINSEDYTGLEIGKYYVIKVNGSDLKGNSVSNGVVTYAIKFMPVNTTAPDIKISKINESDATSSLSIGVQDIYFKGKVSYFPDTITLKVYIGNSEESGNDPVMISEPIYNSGSTANGFTITDPVNSSQKNSFDFEFTLSKTDIENKIKEEGGIIPADKTIDVAIIAALANANVEGAASVQVTVDRQAPVFEDDYVITPTVEESDVSYVNGTISVEASVSDNVTMNPIVKYSFDGENWTDIGKTRKIKIQNIDTTRFEDDSVQKLILKAFDGVGNSAVKEITLNVKQSTDTPKINLSNVYTEVLSVESIASTQNNIFGRSANNKLLGTIEDDDGIDSYEIIFDGTLYGGSQVTKEAVPCNGKTTANVNYEVPKTEGTYDVILYVKDSKQDNTGYNSYNPEKTIKFATIAVDDGAPQLSVKTASGAFQAANDIFELAGSVDDKNCTVEIFSDEECKTKIDTATINQLNGDWTYPVTTTSDGKTIYIQAMDIYGQKVSKSFMYKIDARAPTLEITTLAGEDYPAENPGLVEKYASMTTLYTIKGSVQDFGSSGNKEDSSKLEDFVYYVAAPCEPVKIKKGDKYYYSITDFTYDNGTTDVVSDDITYSWKKASISTDTSGNSSWVANVDLSDTHFYTDGESYSVYFAVKDGAANTSFIEDNITCNAVKLCIDSTNPTIQSISHTSDAEHNLTITAKAFDGQSGMPDNSKDAVKLILNGSNSSVVPAVETVTEDIDGISYTVYTFTVPASNLSDGKNTYNVTAYDKAKNSATYGINGEIDNSAPVISLVNPLLNNNRSSDGYYFTNKDVNVENTVTASGNYIGSYKYVETKDGISGAEKEVSGGSFYKDATFSESTSVATEKKAYKGTLVFSKGTVSAKYEQKFTAINAYGAESTDSIKYIVDLDKPTLTDIVCSPEAKDKYIDATKVLLITGYAVDGQLSDSGDEITIVDGITKKIANKNFQSGLSDVQYSLYKGKAASWQDTWTAETENMKVFWESTTGLSSWKIKLNLEEEGDYTVFIRAIDNVGNDTYATPIQIIADLKDPEFEITKVNDVEVANAFSQFYKQEIVIEGTVTETYLKSFNVYADGNETPVTLQKQPVSLSEEETQNWKLTIPAVDGDHLIKVTVEDYFGKTAEKTYKTTIDKTKPDWNKRDASTAGESTFGGIKVDLLNSESGHPWFNSQSQTIYGEFYEAGSGISKIYYQVATASADGAGINYGAKIDVTANDIGDYENFRTTIGGLAISNYPNVIRLWAEDLAGNESDEIIFDIYVDSEKPELENITFSTGDISDKAITGAILSNGKNAITLKGTYKDDASGVDTIKVVTSKSDGVNTDSIELTAKKTPVSGKSYDGTWTVTIPTTGTNSLATLNDFSSYTIYIKVKDNAGNESDNNKFELQMDTAAPVTSISSPTADSTLNGIVTLSGTVEEENTPLSVALYYYKVENKAAGDAGITVPTALSDWTLLKKLSTSTGTDTKTEKYGVAVSDIYGWKISDYNINSLLSNGKSKAALYLLPVAYDEAGNCSVAVNAISPEKYNSYTIDLDSDRPLIKFSSLGQATGDLIKYSSSVSGTIEDDDGVVKILKISPDAITTQSEWDAYTQPENTLTFSSGSFTYTPASSDDGNKTMYFYIEDSAGGKFWTSNTAGILKMPKQSFKTAADYSIAADNNGVVSYITDSSPAVVGNLKFVSDSETFTYDKTGITFADMQSKNMAGGSLDRFLMFGISAEDPNGIKSVEFNFEDDNIFNQIYVAEDSDSTTTGMTYVSDSKMYYTAPIDLDNVGSGVITVTITITDGADIETTVQKTITVDNGAPTLDMSSPATDDVVTGKVTLTGTTSDEMSAISTIKYLVLNNTYLTSTGVAKEADIKAKLKSADYTCENLGAANNTSWKFELTDLPCGKKVGTDKHLDLNDYSYVSHTAQEIYTIPVWFYIVDSLGNEAFIDDKVITYNPYGDRPSASITDPIGTAENPSNTNGMIRINGGATDNIQVKEVYLQIDTNNDGKFDAADITNLAGYKNAKDEKIYENLLYKASGNNLVDVKTSTKVQLNDADAVVDFSANDGQTADFWGIKVTGTNSWNTVINSSVEFQNDYTKEKMLDSEGAQIYDEDGVTPLYYTNKYRIRIRAVAFDNNYTMGSWSDVQEILIDVNAPTVAGKTQSIIERDGDTVVATKDYVSDMFLKGTNSLKVSVEDKSGISKVEYVIADSEAALASTQAVEATSAMLGEEKTWGTGDSQTKGYEVEIPFGVANTYSGSKVVKVIAYKDSAVTTTAYKIFYVNFDNTAPELSYITLNSKKYDDSEKKIVNTNGVFTIGGSVKDEGSGFERFAFYYIRNSENGEGVKSNYRIYNPMLATENRIDLTVGKESGNTPSKELDGKNLYGVEKSVAIDSTGKKLTLTSDIGKFVRAGGIVEIGGFWYLISEKSADGKTITLATACPLKDSASATAFFAYAQIIDNTGTEKPVWSSSIASNATFESDSDDGDEMPESIVKSQSTYTFDASIRSNFIPDGPGKLVVFAFDKAGNISSAEYAASVENNAPRITKVWLGTDLNGDMDFTENEFTTYDVLAKVGMEQSSYEMNTKDFGGERFRVLDKLAVVTEFVGGNNATNKGIKMAFKNNSTTEKLLTADAAHLISATALGDTTAIGERKGRITAAASTFANSGYTGQLTRSKHGYIIDNADLKAGFTSTENYGDSSVTDGVYSERKMSFTFWDDTEDTIQGTNSCSAFLKITDFIVILNDTIAPNVSIDPFFWTSKDDNSLYNNSYKEGHIELSADLNSEAYQKPNVSGKISVRGTAYDEHKIKYIWGKFTDFTAPTGLNYTLPEGETAPEGYTLLARFDGTWHCADNEVSGQAMKFTVDDTDGVTQLGHLVKWQLDIDTSGMTYGCNANSQLDLLVQDAAETIHTSSTSATQKEADGTTAVVPGLKVYSAKDFNIPSYAMSVVPYISGIEGATRSKLGRYAVRAGETITINGFNFPKGNPTITRRNKAGVTLSTIPDANVTRVSSTKVTMVAPEKSGYINMSWAAGSTNNNSNVNERYNIEEGDSTTLANGKNYWTDDRYLSVWSNTARAGSVNPWDGTVRKLKTSESKSNKFYANKSGSAVDEMSNSLDTWFGAWSSPNMMIYDEAGNGDFANKRTLYNNSQAAFVTPVETMDMAIIGGIPWYVFNDNYVGGNSANSWGAGLILAREGYNFPKGDFNSTSSPTPQEFVNIIERQGAGTAADSRDSSGGYDSVLHQFKNPKVSGWYDETPVTVNNGNGSVNYDGTNYIYVSYYDSFSHCLKYAAFSEAWSIDGVGSKWGNLNGTKNFKDLARSATSMAAPKTVVAGVDRMYTAYDFSTDNGEEAGEWSDIMVDPSDHKPVIIYYNKTKGSLEVAHGKTIAPETANYKSAKGAFSDTTEGTKGWTKTKSINPIAGHDFGRYVSAEMDKNGNIHATAQDFTTGALWYVFLRKNGTSYTPTYQIVDAEISAGIWADIQLDNDVASNTTWGQYKPFISYIDQSKKLPKVAYIENFGSGENVVSYFEAVPDANNYEAKDMKTSIMSSVYEAKIKDTGASENNKKALAGIAFNSDMLCIDFLRDE